MLKTFIVFITKTLLLLGLLNCPAVAMPKKLDDEVHKQQSANAVVLFTPQLRPYVHPHILEQNIQRSHPDDFIGATSIDQFFIRTIRGHHTLGHHAFFNGMSNETFPNTNPAIMSYVQQMETFFEDYMRKNPTHIYTSRFLKEFKLKKEIKGINYAWLMVMPLRFAAAISNVTQTDKDFFEDTPVRKLFFGLLQRNAEGKYAWENYTSSIAGVSRYDAKVFKLVSPSRSSCLPRSNRDIIYETMGEHLPMNVPYPVLGTGNFSLSFLVKSYLHDVFPIGIPLERYTAHGVELSPYSFAIHDIFHAEADGRRESLVTHAIKRVAEYSKQGLDTQDILRIYLPCAIHKYQALMGCFKKIYYDTILKFLPYAGVGAFRKAMVGFFEVMHEKYGFSSSPSLYDMNDLDEIFKLVIQPTEVATAYTTEKNFDDVLEKDPFHTSPLDGTSPMTNQDIANWVIQHELLGNAQEYQNRVDIPVSRALLREHKDNISSFEVSRDEEVIKIRFSLFNGETLTYLYLTLCHLWRTADDEISRLHYAGISFVKPNLEDPVHARQVALKTLDKIENGQQECINHFYRVASFLAHLGEENSLNQRFWRWHFAQERKLKTTLSPLFSEKRGIETLRSMHNCQNNNDA